MNTCLSVVRIASLGSTVHCRTSVYTVTLTDGGKGGGLLKVFIMINDMLPTPCVAKSGGYRLRK
jgi:hypothetical protein